MDGPGEEDFARSEPLEREASHPQVVALWYRKAPLAPQTWQSGFFLPGDRLEEEGADEEEEHGDHVGGDAMRDLPQS